MQVPAKCSKQNELLIADCNALRLYVRDKLQINPICSGDVMPPLPQAVFAVDSISRNAANVTELPIFSSSPDIELCTAEADVLNVVSYEVLCT
jgi:hypothetical protein